MKKIFFGLISVALLLAGCSAPPSEVAPQTGAIAPSFELVSLDGESVSLADFSGKVVLLNFWATWCGPCRFEMPALQERFENSELEVLAVNYNEGEDLVRPYVEELGLTFPILMDPDSEIQQLYQVRGYPTSFIVDEQGVIGVVHIGYLAEEQLDSYLQDMRILN